MYQYKYPHPSVTTDCVIFGFDGSKIKILLIQRGINPYKDQWALPGGFVHIDETAEEGARRELREETGVEQTEMYQFHTFSAVDRDPRERVITIAYYALVKMSEVRGGDDAKNAQWFALNELPTLAFDHQEIVERAIDELRRSIHFRPIGFDLMPEVFTMSQIQHLYEEILQHTFDRRNFAKKILRLGILVEAETRPENTPTRIPNKYRFDKDAYQALKQSSFMLEF